MLTCEDTDNEWEHFILLMLTCEHTDNKWEHFILPMLTCQDTANSNSNKWEQFILLMLTCKDTAKWKWFKLQMLTLTAKHPPAVCNNTQNHCTRDLGHAWTSHGLVKYWRNKNTSYLKNTEELPPVVQVVGWLVVKQKPVGNGWMHSQHTLSYCQSVCQRLQRLSSAMKVPTTTFSHFLLFFL